MRVVSFVPSWTETLLWADVDVVGRTRFCIHPEEKIKSIPAVGGTKDIDLVRLKSLNPDIVIFDREENTEAMAAECPFSWLSTHITSIHDMPRELKFLAEKLQAPKLFDLATRWERVLKTKIPTLKNPPGFMDWQTEPSEPWIQASRQWVYVIWAHPWMAATAKTFIGSMCEHLGWPLWTPAFPPEPVSAASKYPAFQPNDFIPVTAESVKGLLAPGISQTAFLCSSEPYPFLKKREVLAELPGPTALVDGEKLSWFGLRSLTYLESLITDV